MHPKKHPAYTTILYPISHSRLHPVCSARPLTRTGRRPKVLVASISSLVELVSSVWKFGSDPCIMTHVQWPMCMGIGLIWQKYMVSPRCFSHCMRSFGVKHESFSNKLNGHPGYFLPRNSADAELTAERTGPSTRTSTWPSGRQPRWPRTFPPWHKLKACFQTWRNGQLSLHVTASDLTPVTSDRLCLPIASGGPHMCQGMPEECGNAKPICSLFAMIKW